MSSHQSQPNHPLVVWGACVLWFLSVNAIAWALVLFFWQNVGNMLVMIETDVVNAVVLLSGLMMLPKNCHLLHSIAKGVTIDRRMKVLCCPLWMCMLWIVLINLAGAILSIHRMYSVHNVSNILSRSLQHYRDTPAYRHFVDNLQWSLQCCGLTSYRDWFAHDWIEKIRDFELGPHPLHRSAGAGDNVKSDSVPLSCCRSGSCISNYLSELGTASIYTRGCRDTVQCIVRYSMMAHLLFFGAVVVTESLMYRHIPDAQGHGSRAGSRRRGRSTVHLQHLMAARDGFTADSTGTSRSYHVEVEDSRGTVSTALRAGNLNDID